MWSERRRDSGYAEKQEQKGKTRKSGQWRDGVLVLSGGCAVRSSSQAIGDVVEKLRVSALGG